MTTNYLSTLSILDLSTTKACVNTYKPLIQRLNGEKITRPSIFPCFVITTTKKLPCTLYIKCMYDVKVMAVNTFHLPVWGFQLNLEV